MSRPRDHAPGQGRVSLSSLTLFMIDFKQDESVFRSHTFMPL